MPRPKSPFPREKVHVAIRPDLLARLRLLFWSDNNQTRLIKGAISDFINAAIEEKLASLPKEGSEDPRL